MDYSNEDQEAMVKSSLKVEELFNPIKVFCNLFTKTIATDLQLLREVNHHIDPKLGSEQLASQRPSGYKFGQQINNKLNPEVECECMYSARTDKNSIVIFCVAKGNQPDKGRFVTD